MYCLNQVYNGDPCSTRQRYGSEEALSSGHCIEGYCTGGASPTLYLQHTRGQKELVIPVYQQRVKKWTRFCTRSHVEISSCTRHAPVMHRWHWHVNVGQCRRHWRVITASYFFNVMTWHCHLSHPQKESWISLAFLLLLFSTSTIMSSSPILR